MKFEVINVSCLQQLWEWEKWEKIPNAFASHYPFLMIKIIELFILLDDRLRVGGGERIARDSSGFYTEEETEMHKI